MTDLVPDGNDGPSVADTDPQEAGQLADHVNSTLVMASLDHPDHRVQGIVEEMGIDLGLEGVQLTPSLFLLLRKDVLHQLIDLLNGGPERPAQVFHLLRASDIDLRT